MDTRNSKRARTSTASTAWRWNSDLHTHMGKLAGGAHRKNPIFTMWDSAAARRVRNAALTFSISHEWGTHGKPTRTCKARGRHHCLETRRRWTGTRLAACAKKPARQRTESACCHCGSTDEGDPSPGGSQFSASHLCRRSASVDSGVAPIHLRAPARNGEMCTAVPSHPKAAWSISPTFGSGLNAATRTIASVLADIACWRASADTSCNSRSNSCLRASASLASELSRLKASRHCAACSLSDCISVPQKVGVEISRRPSRSRGRPRQRLAVDMQPQQTKRVEAGYREVPEPGERTNVRNRRRDVDALAQHGSLLR